jgi:hypothetical protein
MAAPEPSPFFLVGTTRSGTSLLGLMLRNHPDISFPGEFEFAFDFEFAAEHGRAPTLADYHEHLLLDRHFRHHQLRIDTSLPRPDLVRSLLKQMNEDGGGATRPLVGVAVHRHYDQLFAIWPEARFIHLRRDPRDVARSWMEYGWSGNAWAAARTWGALERLWSEVRSRIPKERVFELRFEDLVSDPPASLEAICEFLGVAYDAQMLDYHRSSTYGPVDPKQVAKWRTALSPNEQRIFEGEIGDLLVARGYERCGLPPLHVGPLLARWFAFDDRLRRLRVRLRLFGFRNWFFDKIAVGLGNKDWHGKLELERQAVINANLK